MKEPTYDLPVSLQHLPYPRAQDHTVDGESCHFLIGCACEVQNVVNLGATQEFKLFVPPGHLLAKSFFLSLTLRKEEK